VFRANPWNRTRTLELVKPQILVDALTEIYREPLNHPARRKERVRGFRPRQDTECHPHSLRETPTARSRPRLERAIVRVVQIHL
jgi:hypothetical protein